jgi:hypothetical protein
MRKQVGLRRFRFPRWQILITDLPEAQEADSNPSECKRVVCRRSKVSTTFKWVPGLHKCSRVADILQSSSSFDRAQRWRIHVGLCSGCPFLLVLFAFRLFQSQVLVFRAPPLVLCTPDRVWAIGSRTSVSLFIRLFMRECHDGGQRHRSMYGRHKRTCDCTWISCRSCVE